MNERIKELLIQAIKEIGPDDTDNGAKEKTLMKFAELIVRECIEQIDDVINETGKNGAYLAYKRVKEHFGVEL